jgi:hypothetical protein
MFLDLHPMESSLCLSDLLTAHEPESCKRLQINAATFRFMKSANTGAARGAVSFLKEALAQLPAGMWLRTVLATAVSLTAASWISFWHVPCPMGWWRG